MSPSPSDANAPGFLYSATAKWLTYACVAVLLLSWLITAIANLYTDLYINHVAGAWVALGHWTTQGVYYPALEFEGHYGGTRFGPLAIALQAAAHWAIGDPIAGPKLLHIIYMLALILGLWFVLKPLSLPGHLRLFFAVVPVMTWVGYIAGLSIRHDALATALQVWGLALLVSWPRLTARLVVAAAILFALAPLAKLSALWGGCTGLLLLAIANPRHLLIFVPTGLATLALGLGLAELFSDGRFSENMRDCLFLHDGLAGQVISGSRLYGGLRVLLLQGLTELLMWLMFPLSIVGVVICLKRLPFVAIASVLVWAMTGYLLTRLGVDWNHLIDLIVVVAIGSACVFAWSMGGLNRSLEKQGSSDPASAPHLALPMVFVLFQVLALAYLLVPVNGGKAWGPRAEQAYQSALHLAGADPLPSAEQLVLAQLSPEDRVISYLPHVPVLLGQDPIVLDSWMLRYYFLSHPQAEETFVSQVEAQAFDAFVFDASAGSDLQVADWHFGKATLEAVRENYERVEGEAYAVFRPIEAGGGR